MYIIQQHSNACGPVAIYNAYKWLYGKSKDLPCSLRSLVKQCNMNTEYGTYPWDFGRVVSKMLQIKSRPIYDIRKIAEMNAFILLFSHTDDAAHYVFIYQENATYHIFNAINLKPGKPFYHQILTSKQFKTQYLYIQPRCKGLDYPQAWKLN